MHASQRAMLYYYYERPSSGLSCVLGDLNVITHGKARRRKTLRITLNVYGEEFEGFNRTEDFRWPQMCARMRM